MAKEDERWLEALSSVYLDHRFLPPTDGTLQALSLPPTFDRFSRWHGENRVFIAERIAPRRHARPPSKKSKRKQKQASGDAFASASEGQMPPAIRAHEVSLRNILIAGNNGGLSLAAILHSHAPLAYFLRHLLQRTTTPPTDDGAVRAVTALFALLESQEILWQQQKSTLGGSSMGRRRDDGVLTAGSIFYRLFFRKLALAPQAASQAAQEMPLRAIQEHCHGILQRVYFEEFLPSDGHQSEFWERMLAEQLPIHIIRQRGYSRKAAATVLLEWLVKQLERAPSNPSTLDNNPDDDDKAGPLLRWWRKQIGTKKPLKKMQIKGSLTAASHGDSIRFHWHMTARFVESRLGWECGDLLARVQLWPPIGDEGEEGVGGGVESGHRASSSDGQRNRKDAIDFY